MKNIVVYESRYGSTEKYAKWIAKELNCELIKRKDISIEKLSEYDNVIYGGWLHASGIKGFDIISKNNDKLKEKKIIVFMVGCSPGREDEVKSVADKNFANMNNIKYFYLRGAFNYQSLNKVDKVLMSMLKMKLKSMKEEEHTEDTRGLLDSYTNPIDFTNKENTKSLISYVRSL